LRGLQPPLFLGGLREWNGNRENRNSPSTSPRRKTGAGSFFLFLLRGYPFLDPGIRIAKGCLRAGYLLRRRREMKKIYSKVLFIALIVSTIILSGIHITFGVH
jgi:hypothetical protein